MIYIVFMSAISAFDIRVSCKHSAVHVPIFKCYAHLL